MFRRTLIPLSMAALVAMALPGVAGASYTYTGTSGDDIIYFGHCAACLSGRGAVKICRYNSDMALQSTVLAPMSTGTLTIRGSNGNDLIIATDDDDDRDDCRLDSFNGIYTTFSTVFIDGGNGNDGLFGTVGDQTLYGGNDNDLLRGWPGNDLLNGGPGNDYLIGDQGDDLLYGWSGDDVLVGGEGDDYVNGGTGWDTFRCRDPRSPTTWDGGHASDCGDSVRAIAELSQERDPYEEWVWMNPHFRNGVTFERQTTSKTGLLLNDRAGGASILVDDFGDVPIAGDFDRDGRVDDVAVFRPASGRWYYDTDHNGTTNYSRGPWGRRGDRPVAGDFDRDGRIDDVAVFRPSNRTWYFDLNHNGTTDYSRVWGLAGDVPIAGDFDGDGRVDDIAVFRPSSRRWYFDHNHDGSTNSWGGPYGAAGDIPVVGDFDRDGRYDDIVTFNPHQGVWTFDLDCNRSVDYTRTFGIVGDIPLAGDFDRDGRADDLATFYTQNRVWYYHHNQSTSVSAAFGPWGNAGEPLRVAHRQYNNSCGPSSLSMVMDYLGRSRTSQRLCLPRNLGSPATSQSCSLYPATAVDVGHYLSMEHIMYMGFRRQHNQVPGWAASHSAFITAGGSLVNGNGGTGTWYDVHYDIGNVSYNPATDTIIGNVQRWTENAGGVGIPGDDPSGRGLVWVANEFSPSYQDARWVGSSVGAGQPFSSLSHLKEVIRNFIDRNIPLVIGVESGGHFNTLIGYWDRPEGFYIYTADPLDGKARPFYMRPMRWVKLKLDSTTLPVSGSVKGSGAMTGMIIYAHGQHCQSSHGWAKQIDNRRPGDTLCGHL